MADISAANVTKEKLCYLFPKLKLQWKPHACKKDIRSVFSHCGMCRTIHISEDKITRESLTEAEI